jgi:FtsP/CotA-like multicopper oxidase with cupredoxin domain
MDNMNWMRRKFLQGSSLLGASFLLGRTAAAQHEGHKMPGQKPKTENPKTNKPAVKPDHDHAKMMAEQAKQPAGQYVPVQTPDLPKLEYTMDGNVKVFNLRAEVVHCEIMPKTHMGPARKMWGWGYNGSVPGPMIEVVEGDRVRVIFENKLPEADDGALARAGNPDRDGRHALHQPADGRAGRRVHLRIHGQSARHVLLPLARRDAGDDWA